MLHNNDSIGATQGGQTGDFDLIGKDYKWYIFPANLGDDISPNDSTIFPDTRKQLLIIRGFLDVVFFKSE